MVRRRAGGLSPQADGRPQGESECGVCKEEVSWRKGEEGKGGGRRGGGVGRSTQPPEDTGPGSPTPSSGLAGAGWTSVSSLPGDGGHPTRPWGRRLGGFCRDRWQWL